MKVKVDAASNITKLKVQDKTHVATNSTEKDNEDEEPKQQKTENESKQQKLSASGSLSNAEEMAEQKAKQENTFNIQLPLLTTTTTSLAAQRSNLNVSFCFTKYQLYFLVYQFFLFK